MSKSGDYKLSCCLKETILSIVPIRNAETVNWTKSYRLPDFFGGGGKGEI